MNSGAVFSADRVYRYTLWRQWDAALPTMAVIGLNPSTADETTDDPTIRRCVGFAKREGCGRLVMLNLFAFRATSPKDLKAYDGPIVGELNDAMIRVHSREAAKVVAAWGVHGALMDRGNDVRMLIHDLLCFGVTKHGHPKHPLYLPSSTPLVWLP